MPTEKHIAATQALLAKYDAQEKPPLVVRETENPRNVAPPPAEAQTAEAPVEQVIEVPGTTMPRSAPARQAPAARPQSKADKLQRSLDIERKAQAVRAKSRAERDASLARQREAESRVREIDSRESRVQSAETRIGQIQSALRREIDLLKSNPTDFMRRHGMDAAAVADFQRRGLDPNARRAELMEERLAQEIQRLERASQEKIDAIVNALESDRVQTANQNFIDHVSGDDRFEALNTIYSPDELLQQAEKLAQHNEKLQLGWDGDRLCEELEARARKDPRWGRIQSRFQPRTKPATPAPATRTRTPPNEPQVDTDVEEAGDLPPDVAADRPRTRTTSNAPSVSPRERHRRHVERLGSARRFTFG